MSAVEVLGAARRAAAHVDADAVQGQGPLPEGLDQPEHRALGLGHRDVAELRAGARHGVPHQGVGVHAQADRRRVGGRRVPEAGRDTEDGDSLLVRRPQLSAAPPPGEHRERLELPPAQPAQRHRETHRPAVRPALGEPADEVVVAAGRHRRREVRPGAERDPVTEEGADRLDADPLHEVAETRLVALLARPLDAEQVEQRGGHRHDLFGAHQHRQVPGEVRILPLGAADEHLEQHLPPDAPGEEAQVLRPEVDRMLGRAIEADVELAREIRVLPVVDEERGHVAAELARIDQLVREDAAERVREDVADVVVAGLLRGQPHRGQPLDDLRHALDAEPLHLEVGARGDVDDPVTVLVGDGRDSRGPAPRSARWP